MPGAPKRGRAARLQVVSDEPKKAEPSPRRRQAARPAATGADLVAKDGPSPGGRQPSRQIGSGAERVDEQSIVALRNRQVADIGKQIKELRRNHYTLGQLAEASGVSVGLLSRLENGVGNPSFASLNAIARALDVDIHRFFDTAYDSAVLLPNGDRTVMHNVKTRVEFELLAANLASAERAGLVATLIRLPAAHIDAEWVPEASGSRDQLELVLHGSVTIQIENETYQLDEGDAIMFDASRRHRRISNSRTETALLFCVSRQIDCL